MGGKHTFTYMCVPHAPANTCKLQGCGAEDPQKLKASETQAVDRQQERRGDEGREDGSQEQARRSCMASRDTRPATALTHHDSFQTHLKQLDTSVSSQCDST